MQQCAPTLHLSIYAADCISSLPDHSLSCIFQLTLAVSLAISVGSFLPGLCFFIYQFWSYLVETDVLVYVSVFSIQLLYIVAHFVNKTTKIVLAVGLNQLLQWSLL